MGLGLFISKCIVQGHGGRIWAENKPVLGGIVCFTVPVDAPAVVTEVTARGDT